MDEEEVEVIPKVGDDDHHDDQRKIRAVAVLGGSGFLGMNVVLELCRQGYQPIRVFGLPGSDTEHLRRLPNVTFVAGDITNESDVDNVVRGVDAVINVVGDTSFFRLYFERQRRINVDGPTAVARACIRNGIKRLVHTSTVDALGYNPDGFADENWNFFNFSNMGYNYAETKREGQRRLLEYNGRSGLEIVVIYPGAMIGPYDVTLQFGRLFFDLRDGKVPGSPCGGASFAHVRDVADAHVSALTRGRPGEGYICAGTFADNHHRFKEMMDAISNRMGCKPPRFVLPRWLLVLYAYIVEFIAIWFTHKAPDMNPGQARYMSVYAKYDSSKAMKELGYKVTPLRQMIDDAYDWYKSNNYL